MSERMAFIGVTTGSSSIMRIFPRWAEILDLPTRTLEGVDLPLDAEPARYREAVTAIRDDPAHRGALVTTHKMALHEAAHDLFDELDDFARACGEISCISHRAGRLRGGAMDPLTVGLALAEILPEGHFRAERDALVLGAGGAGLALVWRLVERADLPRRIVVTDPRQDRLDHLERVIREHAPDAPLELRGAGEDAVLTALEEAPEGSLVVNASGLGKDRPGSPLPDGALLPPRAVVWDFNYRGSLEFLAQARAQQAQRDLTVVDGWRYFIHGWSQAIGEVFDVPITAEVTERLSRAAGEA